MRCLGTSDTARVRSRLRAQWKEFFPLCEHPDTAILFKLMCLYFGAFLLKNDAAFLIGMVNP